MRRGWRRWSVPGACLVHVSAATTSRLLLLQTQALHQLGKHGVVFRDDLAELLTSGKGRLETDGLGCLLEKLALYGEPRGFLELDHGFFRRAGWRRQTAPHCHG